MNQLFSLLGAERYNPLSVALTEDPVIMVVYITLYIIIALACLALAAVISMRNRMGMVSVVAERSSLATLIGVMFLLISLGSIIDIITIFIGVYRLDVVITGALAGVSCLTAYLAAVDFFTQPDA